MNRDKNLNPLLLSCTGPELEPLSEIIAKSKFSNLKSYEAYKANPGRPDFFVDALANEVRLFGGDTFMNICRGDDGALLDPSKRNGPPYKEVLLNVASKCGVKSSAGKQYQPNARVGDVEKALLQKLLDDAYAKMSESEQKEVVEQMSAQAGKQFSWASGIPLATLLAQAGIQMSGFMAYQIAVIVANGLAKAVLGKGLAFATNAALTKSVSLFAGPLGLVFSGLWLIKDLSGPAYRITIPCVVQIAFLRQLKELQKDKRARVAVNDAVGESQTAAAKAEEPRAPSGHVVGKAVSGYHTRAVIEERIKALAAKNVSIILLGETGSGKEFYATDIHKQSGRRDKRLEIINCGSLPKARIDSELFGHKKGAFTDAKEDYIGRIRAADGGTVLLDEIGDLPEPCWTNLLRFLAGSPDGLRQIYPVGGCEPVTVDVRVLAATNKVGQIPEDAWHRFEFDLRIPPLRCRKDEIDGLAAEFFDESKTLADKSGMRFSGDERKALASADYEWPGNIRQLKKAIKQAVMFCKRSDGKGHTRLLAEDVLQAAREIESPV